jgi:hypothetical protein
MNKRIPFFLSLIFISVLSCRAAVLVVSNVPEHNAAHKSVQSAVELASPYDTIYVRASTLNYGNVYLEKPLTLIGEGFTGDNPEGITSKLTRVLLTSNPYQRTISSGSKIIGFEFPYFPGERPNIVTVYQEKNPIDNITIERNWIWFIQVVGSAHNWKINNNIIRGWVDGGGGSGLGAQGFKMSNNIITSIKGFTRGESLINNNIILGKLENIQHADIFNNIFTSSEAPLDRVEACILRHNFAVTENVFNGECYRPASFNGKNYCGGSQNRAINNKSGVDPGFVLWPGDDIKGGSAFELAQSSPVRKSGLRGQDPGIFAGQYPFPVEAFENRLIGDPFPSYVIRIK